MIVGPGPSVARSDFAGKKVAILGGGDSAVENFTMACDRGAADVRIFARSIKARADMISTVAPEKVVLGSYTVDEKSNSVNGEVFDQILVLYGYEASSESLLGLDLAMRPDGFVMTDTDCLTSKNNVYAIGELARRGHPCCVTSMADGVAVAKAIQRRIESTAISRFAGLTKRAIGLGLAVLK
ncbi:NAD(P)/FAD-dependent oxidoreductase [Rhodoferax antarcticus]